MCVCMHACVHIFWTFYVQVSMKNVNPWRSCHFAIEVQGHVSKVLNFYPWEASICSLFPLIKTQKWTVQSAPKHEWVLFILRSTQALWKLALEHGSKWKRHHRPNEKLNTIYSSPLVRDLSLLSFEWFWNAFSSWAQSLRGWAASLTSFPCLAANEIPSSFFLSILHRNLGFNHVGSPDSFLFMYPSLSVLTLLSFAFDVTTFMVCKQPKLTDEYTLFVGWLAFQQIKLWKIIWVGKGHLAMKLMLLGTREGVWDCK